jgi:hypothetical protein
MAAQQRLRSHSFVQRATPYVGRLCARQQITPQRYLTRRGQGLRELIAHW